MLHTILSTHAWALESKYFAQIKPIVLKRLQDGDLTAEVITSEKKENAPVPMVVGATGVGFVSSAVAYSAFEAAGGAGRANGDGSAEVKVALIPLRGAMTKYGGACSYGTKDVRRWLANAASNPEIGAAVLVTDSPGGAVDGTEDLGKDIKNFPKPIVGFVDGMAASAGYWATSQAQEIFINSGTTAWVGSIGTLIAHVDQSQFLEKQGLKVTYITADASVDKVKGNSTQPLDDEALAMFKADLNTINDTFISTVKSGRGDRIAEQSKWDSAKVFNGQEALKLGMVDKIGTLEDAIVRAAQLAQGTSSKSKKQSSNNTPMKFSGFASKFPKLSAALGFAATQDEVEVDETVLANAEKAVAAANTAKETAEQALATANASLATVTTERDGLKTQVATLEEWKKNAGGTTPPKEDLNSQDPENTPKLSAHNQRAKELMDRKRNEK